MSVTADNNLISETYQSGVLLIHLLNRCNLFCQHCYMDAKTHGDIFLPKDLVIRSLEETTRLDIGTVYLSGGEPFLYPDLESILSAVTHIHKYELMISSNGTTINNRILPLLKNCKACVQISFDGPEEYHDQFRGRKGAFAATCEGISKLINAGITVSLVSTLCRDNINFLPWIAHWAFSHGIDHLTIQPLWQLGRGYDIRDRKLNEKEMGDLFLQLSDLGHNYKDKGLNFSMVYRNRYHLLEHPCAAYACDGKKCHRKIEKEIKKLVIKENGTVLPEIATLNPCFALGNIYENNLEELVKRYFKSGYDDFNHFCQSVYNEVIPNATSPIIPWDEIISERSWSAEDGLSPRNTTIISTAAIPQLIPAVEGEA